MKSLQIEFLEGDDRLEVFRGDPIIIGIFYILVKNGDQLAAVPKFLADVEEYVSKPIMMIKEKYKEEDVVLVEKIYFNPSNTIAKYFYYLLSDVLKPEALITTENNCVPTIVLANFQQIMIEYQGPDLSLIGLLNSCINTVINLGFFEDQILNTSFNVIFFNNFFEHRDKSTKTIDLLRALR